MDFEWDELKAATNLEKHDVSFIEAETVFANDLALFLMMKLIRWMKGERLLLVIPNTIDCY